MIALAVHGGAWDIPKNSVAAHRDGVAEALRIGWAVLKKGGSAIQAVEASIVSMENDETFDAGRGSFINQIGDVELDAGFMDGRTLRAGAIAAVQNVKNPITLARAIMEKSDEILLVGTGATRFAKEHRIPTCRQDDLITVRELSRWRKVQARENFSTKDAFRKDMMPSDTVGAVAVDAKGNVAAGTSTGGTPNKFPGRVGDSPLIGCGTYADNEIGGASTSGWGESMIRVVMAKTALDLLARFGGDPQKAAEESIRILEKKVKGYGGVVIVTPTGDIGMHFNTPRMARASMTSSMRSPVIVV